MPIACVLRGSVRQSRAPAASVVRGSRWLGAGTSGRVRPLEGVRGVRCGSSATHWLLAWRDEDCRVRVEPLLAVLVAPDSLLSAQSTHSAAALRPHTARAPAHLTIAFGPRPARSPAARGVAPGHAAERGCASESKVYDGKADEQVRYFGLAGHSRAQVAADLQLCADRTAAGGARAKKDDNRQAAEIEPQH